MEVRLVPEAAAELRALPAGERAAILSALKKLEAGGATLRAPHTSQVKGSTLRELRPRRGRSPWRALYRRLGDTMVVAAVVPEAESDRQGFNRGVRQAEQRLSKIEEDPT